MQTTVWKYGVKATYQAPPLLTDQIHRAHVLSNKMVEIEHAYLETIANVWREHAEVAEAETELQAALAQLEQLSVELRRARVQNQTTEATPDAKAAMKAVREAVGVAKKKFKEAKAAAKDTLKPKLAEASDARHAARTAARKEAVDAGLFWATGTDVLRKAVTAEKLVANAWRSGKQAARRFKRWDGTGTITTQVMWSTGMEPLTPAVLASEKSPRRNVFVLTPYIPEAEWPKGRGPHRHGTIKLQIAKGAGNMIELPIAYHRPLPDNGEIKQVQITCRRIGTQFRYSVQVTVNLPDPEPKSDGVPVMVTTHWNEVPNGAGAIQVAEIYSEFINFPELELPEQVRDVIIPGDNDNSIKVIVPADWRAHLESFAAIRGYRSDLLNLVQPFVVKYLQENPEFAESVDVATADVERWRSHHRFQWLATKWPEGQVFDETLHAQILNKMMSFRPHKNETPEHFQKRKAARKAKLTPLSTFALWRLRDRHLEDYEAHGSTQVLDRRRYKWRNVVAFVCSFASNIYLDAPAVAEIKRIPAVENGDTKGNRKSRVQSHIAAPGEMAAMFEHAAHRRGIKLVNSRKEKEEK